MESSFTAPYHFINQAELSKEPSNAIIGVDYPADRNVADGHHPPAVHEHPLHGHGLPRGD